MDLAKHLTFMLTEMISQHSLIITDYDSCFGANDAYIELSPFGGTPLNLLLLICIIGLDQMNLQVQSKIFTI